MISIAAANEFNFEVIFSIMALRRGSIIGFGSQISGLGFMHEGYATQI
jgi:hypothetical protein